MAGEEEFNVVAVMIFGKRRVDRFPTRERRRIYSTYPATATAETNSTASKRSPRTIPA